MTTGYTLWDELRADPVQPLSIKDRLNTVGKMGDSLAALKLEPSPPVEDWRRLSDMVNMATTLVDMGEMLDSHALLADACEAMVKASDRYKAGQALRFDGPGVQAIRKGQQRVSGRVVAL